MNNLKRLQASFFSVIFVGLVLLILTLYPVYKNNTQQNQISVQSVADLQLAPHSDQASKEITGTGSGPSKVSAVTTLSGCVLNTLFSSSKNTVSPTGTLNYTLRIKNQGSVPCTNASISVYYSDNEVFLNSSPRPTASDYYWRLGNIMMNEEKVIIFSTKPKKSSGVVQTEVCATANNSDDACLSLVATIVSDNNVIVEPTQAPATPVSISPMPVVSAPKTTSAPISNPASSKEYGTWIWTSPIQMTAAYRQRVLDGAALNGINTLYVTIDDYIAIDALPEGATKKVKIKNYSDALEQFIIAAKSLGFTVDVAAGWRDWAEPAQKYKAAVIADFVINYNATYDQKIRALQFDIEPYLLPSYNNNKGILLKNFVQLTDEIANRLGNNSVAFSLVIPHFYDDAQKWTPSITYGGVTTYTFNHLLRILDRRPNSTIILMSYRNFSEGKDGTIQISNVEVQQASTGNHSTKVIVAQETGDVEPDYVTFFGLPKTEYIKQVGLINNAFESMKNFGGIAVHYIDPFLNLR